MGYCLKTLKHLTLHSVFLEIAIAILKGQLALLEERPSPGHSGPQLSLQRTQLSFGLAHTDWTLPRDAPSTLQAVFSPTKILRVKSESE